MESDRRGNMCCQWDLMMMMMMIIFGAPLPHLIFMACLEPDNSILKSYLFFLNFSQ